MIERDISYKLMLDRYYIILLNSVGEMLTINFINGDIINGILFAVDPKNSEFFIINNPRRLSRTGVPIYLKESQLKIYFKEISFIKVELKSLKPKTKNNFKTDTQVSMQKNLGDQKILGEKLVKYEFSGNEKFGALEDEPNDEKWNQFEVNKQKYNVKSTYDENLYTTSLDKSKLTNEQKIFADKIYNDIYNSKNNEENNNIHILEDRGIIQEQEDDNCNEEDKYSYVVRNAGISNYNNNINNINMINNNCNNSYNIFNRNQNINNYNKDYNLKGVMNNINVDKNVSK